MSKRRSWVRVVVLGIVVTATASALAPRADAAAQAFEIDCSLAVGFEIDAPGTYTLKRTVQTCGADTAAILISASNVVVNLSGRLIDGDDTGSAGIQAVAGTSNITIRNGTVRDFLFGIRLDGGDSSVTELVARSNPTNGIRAVNGNSITNNAVLENGIGVFADDTNRVSGNTVSGNVLDGINLSDDNLIANNAVARNLDNGIVVGNTNTIRRNTVIGNDDVGIFVSNGNAISNNIVSETDGRGVDAVDNNTITTNTLDGNGSGIDVLDGNTVEGNIIRGSLGDGLVASSANTIKGNVANGNDADGIDVNANNVVKRNVANGNGDDGIAAVANNIVKANKANGNVDEGIVIVTPNAGTTVANNRADDNGDFGINAGVGVLGTGTNLASGNGNPGAQCSPADLCI